MPLYLYVCEACGLSVDVSHGLSEEFSEPCEACGGGMRKNYGTIQLSAGATPSRMKERPVEEITPEEAVRRYEKLSSHNGVAE